MRFFDSNESLKVRAICGLHVVVLAWDFTSNLKDLEDDLPDQLYDLAGFAIERTEFSPGGEQVERYMMRGMKRFRYKDEGLPPGALVPLDEHPLQTFQWADYTAKPGVKYGYRVIPMRGKPKLLAADMDGSVYIAVQTEAEANEQSIEPRHDIFSNRGVIGSQAYARKFGTERPNPHAPTSAPMKWLSRGLYEALLAFIGKAADERFGLRAAFYEFHYSPVATAFRAAVDAGADVRIVYDAESGYKEENETSLRDAGLLRQEIATGRTVTEGIRHNKFIILLEDGAPIAVWTGSTNISAGGIFGHSNVGHIIWDRTVARSFLEYWKDLEANLTPGKMRKKNRETSPLPVGRSKSNSVIPLFSPRDEKDSIETLQWYAHRMEDATRMICLTVAFNIDTIFQEVLCQENDVLRYIVKDDDLGKDESIGHDGDILFAAGGRLEDGALANMLKEPSNPLNSNRYIHTKYFLVDPLGDDPLVVTGSANFSRPSQRSNDENMLVIRGDTRVADIYFGEYMRIFDHHYARYLVRKITERGKHDPNAGYLKELPQEWVKLHFNSKSYKSKRRIYFTEVSDS